MMAHWGAASVDFHCVVVRGVKIQTFELVSWPEQLGPSQIELSVKLQAKRADYCVNTRQWLLRQMPFQLGSAAGKLKSHQHKPVQKQAHRQSCTGMAEILVASQMPKNRSAQANRLGQKMPKWETLPGKWALGWS